MVEAEEQVRRSVERSAVLLREVGAEQVEQQRKHARGEDDGITCKDPAAFAISPDEAVDPAPDDSETRTRPVREAGEVPTRPVVSAHRAVPQVALERLVRPEPILPSVPRRTCSLGLAR